MMIFVLIAIVASLPIPLAGRRRHPVRTPRRKLGKSLGICETFSPDDAPHFRICALENTQTRRVSFFVFAKEDINVHLTETTESYQTTQDENGYTSKPADPVTPTSVMNEYNAKSQLQFKKNEYSEVFYKHGYRVSTDKKFDTFSVLRVGISTKIGGYPVPYDVIFRPKNKRTESQLKAFDLQVDRELVTFMYGPGSTQVPTENLPQSIRDILNSLPNPPQAK
jgi:hypothetical protein